MKSGLALLLLVVVAGLAECKPSPADLRAKVQARVEELVAKRGKGDGKGPDRKGGKGGKGDKGEKDDVDWPYGWIEYSALVGKCVAALNWMELLQMDPPEEGVLAEACPKAFEGGQEMLGATDEELMEATMFMREIFPLLQCVNLQAEREEIHVSLYLNGKSAEEDMYLQETAPLFAVCDELFVSVEDEIQELGKDLDQMEDQVVEGKRDAKIKAILRELINTAAKKR